MEIPGAFLARMQSELGSEYEAFLESLSEVPASGLRLNLSRWNLSEASEVLPFLGERIPWSPHGYYYDTQYRPGRHPAWFAGLYYMQEPSAQAPAEFLPVSPGDRVLDLCAAPGGKSTRLAEKLAGTGVLLANDISASRAQILLNNLELSGAANIYVTAESPEHLAEAFPQTFQAVLVDAPCSGEGMMRKDSDIISDWQRRGPEWYAPLQREILAQAAVLTAPGGYILYSTCTFSRAENEDNIKWFLEEFPDFTTVPMPADHGIAEGSLTGTLRLWPHRLQGEGHFLALLQKAGAPNELHLAESSGTMVPPRLSGTKGSRNKKALAFNMEKELPRFGISPERGKLFHKDSLYFFLPDGLPVVKGIRYLRTGLLLGEEKNGRFLPSHALAMAMPSENSVPRIELDWKDERLIRYLKGETLTLSEEEGALPDEYILVCAGHHPLGWAVKSGLRLKNKYPASRRLQ